MFVPSAALILVFVILAWAWQADQDDNGNYTSWGMDRLLAEVQEKIVSGLGWYYVLLVAGLVIFSIWVGVSRYGDIKLGKDDDPPAFRLPAWFAMLFAAGMGIGLVFFGVAEPLWHVASPKPGAETGTSVELAERAFSTTYLHWGLHAWAIYVVVGLALAYAVHRKGRPVSIRWALEPIFGDRIKGGLGDVIDVIAVMGTLFGIATSLGLGVSQISGGLSYLGVIDEVLPTDALTWTAFLLIVGITMIATLSVVSGIGRGIKWLSNFNMVLAGALLLFVLIAGPTVFLLREYVQSIGSYLQNVVQLSFDVTAFQGTAGEGWQSGWTIFYWGWWISWAPFVGVFIARISRGRTVREFVLGVLLVPTLMSFLWFTVMGGSALHRQLFGDRGLIVDGSVSSTTALFELLDGFPLATVTSWAAIVLIVVFFVTSSDSGSYVVDMLSSGGDPNPPVWSRVFWAWMEGAVAVALLAVGGLVALQTAAIIFALPFTLVMIGMAIALVKQFRREHAMVVRAQRRQAREEMTREIIPPVTEHVTEHVTEVFAEQLSNGGNGGSSSSSAPTSTKS